MTLLQNPRRHRFHFSRPLLASIILCGGVSLAPAANIFWVADGGDFNGTFHDTNHWSATQGGASGEPVPDGSDTAVFDNAETTNYEVDLTASHTLGGFTVGTDTVTLDMQTSDINMSSSTVLIGGAGETTVFTITSSAGSGQGSFNSTSNAQFAIGIGANADTEFTVSDGATLDTNGSSGGSPVVGGGTDSTTTMTASGGTIDLAGSSVVFGDGGNAEVNVNVNSGGTLITNGFMNIINTGSPTVTIDIDGGTWNHTHGSRQVQFGSNSSSQSPGVVDFTVQNGGTAFSAADYRYADGVPNRSKGHTVTVLVTDGGSTMRSDNHYIGGGPSDAVESFHEVTVAGGAIVGVIDELRIWESVDTDSNSTFGAPGTLTLDGGIVELDGTAGSPGELNLRGRLRGEGTIRRRAASGPDPVEVHVLTSGNLLVGDTSSTPATGTLTIEDGLLTSDGTIHFDLAGTSMFDTIELTSPGASASIAGLIEIDLIGSYEPALGDVFNLIIADTVSFTGSDNLDSVNFGPGLVGHLSVVSNFSGSLDALQLEVALVPEPNTLFMLGVPLMLYAVRRKRKSPEILFRHNLL